MTKHVLILFFITACTTISNNPNSKSPEDINEDLVSVKIALDQAQASYMKGCVDAYNSVSMSPVFEKCRDIAKLHRKELNQIMGIEDSSSSSDQPKK